MRWSKPLEVHQQRRFGSYLRTKWAESGRMPPVPGADLRRASGSNKTRKNSAKQTALAAVWI